MPCGTPEDWEQLLAATEKGYGGRATAPSATHGEVASFLRLQGKHRIDQVVGGTLADDLAGGAADEDGADEGVEL